MLPHFLTEHRSQIENEVQCEGVCLVDLAYRQVGKSGVLTVLVDQEGGVTLEDCTRINQRLSHWLDERDLIAGPYQLEVNSPGLDRPLQNNRDFSGVVGQSVRVLYEDGAHAVRELFGRLETFTDDSIGVTDRRTGCLVQVLRPRVRRVERLIEFGKKR